MIVKGHCETLFSTWNGLETVLPVDRELEPETSSGPFYFWELFFFLISPCLFATGKSVICKKRQ